MFNQQQVSTYVLDTNVLVSDPTIIFSFNKEDEIVIPISVIEELDNHKHRQDEVGKNAREVMRKLATLFSSDANSSFKEGIRIGEDQGTLFVLSSDDIEPGSKVLPPEMNGKLVDNQILKLCVLLEPSPILVTRDINLKIKASAFGVKCEDTKRTNYQSTSLYSGVKTIETDQVSLTEFNTHKRVVLPGELAEDLHPNQFVVIKDTMTGGSALGRFTNKNKGVLKILPEQFPCKMVTPRNKEQKFALDLLMDPDVQLVTLAGNAGTGKSLLALGAGLTQVIDFKRYQSLVILRPIQPVGKDIGFLPGEESAKLAPWIEPIKDNLRTLLFNDGKRTKRAEETLALKFEDGTIEVECMTFIRGRTIPNAFMIVDEVQNISLHELKTILTRVGEGTKVVLTGDISQIDALNLDSLSNGLTVAIDKFKSQEIAGHVTLTKGERSLLATISSQIL